MLNFEKWFYTNEKIINFIVEKRLTKEQKQDLINEIENTKNLITNIEASETIITDRQISHLYEAVVIVSNFKEQYNNIISIINTLKYTINPHDEFESIIQILSDIENSLKSDNY